MTALRTALAQAQEVNKTVETDKGGLLEQKVRDFMVWLQVCMRTFW